MKRKSGLADHLERRGQQAKRVGTFVSQKPKKPSGNKQYVKGGKLTRKPKY